VTRPWGVTNGRKIADSTRTFVETQIEFEENVALAGNRGSSLSKIIFILYTTTHRSDVHQT